MFKYFKEMRELKKTKLQYEVILLGKLYSFIESIPDITALAQKAKDMNPTDVQKLIVEEIVKYAKNAPTEE